MALAGVEDAVGGDGCDLRLGQDLVEQFGEHKSIAHVTCGEFGRPDFQGFLINPDVDLASDPALGATMLAGVPFAYTLGLDAGAVDQQVQGASEPR